MPKGTRFAERVLSFYYETAEIKNEADVFCHKKSRRVTASGLEVTHSSYIG